MAIAACVKVSHSCPTPCVQSQPLGCGQEPPVMWGVPPRLAALRGCQRRMHVRARLQCRAWIGADFWATPQALVHELGHNLFLAHAGAPTQDGNWDDCECGEFAGAALPPHCAAPGLPRTWPVAASRVCCAGALRS